MALEAAQGPAAAVEGDQQAPGVGGILGDVEPRLARAVGARDAERAGVSPSRAGGAAVSRESWSSRWRASATGSS